MQSYFHAALDISSGFSPTIFARSLAPCSFLDRSTYLNLSPFQAHKESNSDSEPNLESNQMKALFENFSKYYKKKMKKKSKKKRRKKGKVEKKKEEKKEKEMCDGGEMRRER